MASSTAPKRTDLTIAKKYEILQWLEEDLNRSERQAASHFGISKGAVGNIKRKREEITELYENQNLAENRFRKCRKTENDEVNKRTWAWFQRLRSMNVPVSGPMIQTAALKFASVVGLTDFQASNGWLQNFKKAHS